MVKDAEPTTKLFHRAAEGFDIARKSCPTPEGFAAGSPSAAASGVMTDPTAAEPSPSVAVVRKIFDVLNCLIAAQTASPA
jgi:hypothetical protein